MKFKTTHKKLSPNFWWWLLAVVVNLVLVLIWFKYFFTLGEADLLASMALSGQGMGVPMSSNRITDLKHTVAIDYNEAASLWPSLSASAIQIFKSQDKIQITINGKTENGYNLDKPLASFWVVTNDGWLVTSQDFSDWSSLIAVTNDHRTHTISKKLIDPLTGLVFYRLEGANNLVPLKLGENGWSRPGQLFYNLNGRGGFQTSWLEKVNYNEADSLTINSDSLRQRWQFSTIWPDSALFNGAGELFGLVNGENEFIPVNYIKSGLTSLLSGDAFKRVSLGLEYIDLNQLSLNNHYGLLITQVIKDSPAAKAGVKAGDILLSIDEINLDGEVSINEIIQNYRPHDRASLVIQRAGQNHQLNCQF
ncbi:serine protease [Patescibacteria group bacterium]|nr:serine protease [Patescibacteria group bacterium]HPD07692.1 S1C family serine protease [bacterium]HRT11016.1 S1C family serine protease [Patescibacteria group bacterium]HRU89715.1 S1C family serine protease [Patescibacteria group bacterium]